MTIFLQLDVKNKTKQRFFDYKHDVKINEQLCLHIASKRTYVMFELMAVDCFCIASLMMDGVKEKFILAATGWHHQIFLKFS